MGYSVAEAKELGKQDYQSGAPFANNPFYPTDFHGAASPFYLAWCEGWQEEDAVKTEGITGG